MNHDRSDLLELRDKMSSLLNSGSCWRISFTWDEGLKYTKVTPISVLNFILYPSNKMNYAKITYKDVDGTAREDITSNTHVPLFFTTREEAVEAIMMDKLTGTKRYPPVRGPNL